jgi:hypothetical protein
MRATQICPKCQARKFLVIRPFELPNLRPNITLYYQSFAMPLVTLPTEGKLLQEGEFEAWVCASCGLTEWYACALEALLEGKTEASAKVRIVDASAPAAGPFR